MKGLGVWGDVTLQSLSEFARTMTSNGAGTDHAWGGNHFTIGGSVRGGMMHGTYPELRVGGPTSISSTGNQLPTSPWEAIWKPLVDWIGIEPSQWDTVLPNLHRFPQAMVQDKHDVFRYEVAPPPTSPAPPGPPPAFPSPPAPPSTPPSPSPPPPVTFTSEECPPAEGRCCVVLFEGLEGAHCERVPVWDFAGWVHLGPASVTSSQLCGKVRYNWLSASSSHGSQLSPQSETTTSLPSGSGGTAATRVGWFRDPTCPVASPPASG